jgi:bla regulator protein blaR1
MTNWIAETLVATTLLMMVVLILRPWVTDRFGSRVAYLLWAGPALRMILPPLPAGWTGAHATPVENVVVVLTGTSSPPVDAAAATGGGIVWPIVLLAIWLGGAAYFFARHWLAYVRFTAKVNQGGEALFWADTIPVTRSPVVASPIALGIFGKQVIVPMDFEHRFDEDERRLAMAHEIVHHRRFDVLANFAALAMLSLHWFNPIAHLAHRAFRLDQEAACDAVVLNGASTADRHAYGSALFKSAMGRVPLAACAMGATTTLKTRLRRIVAGPVNGRLGMNGLALVAVVVSSGMAFTASSSVAETLAIPATAPRAIVLGGGFVETGGYSSSKNVVADIEKANAPAVRLAKPARWERAVPAPPVFPSPPVAPAAHLAPAPPPPATVWSGSSASNPQSPAPPSPPVTAHCPKQGHIRVALAMVAVGGHEAHETRVLVCRDGHIASRKIMLEALASARESIANEMMLADAQRTRALESLDRQIEHFGSADKNGPESTLK